MPDVANLNEDGLLISVTEVSEDDWKTDSTARTVQLPINNDMRTKIGQYIYDSLNNRFMPCSQEPLSVATRDSPELVEALLFTVCELVDFTGVSLPYDIRNTLYQWKFLLLKEQAR